MHVIMKMHWTRRERERERERERVYVVLHTPVLCSVCSYSSSSLCLGPISGQVGKGPIEVYAVLDLYHSLNVYIHNIQFTYMHCVIYTTFHLSFAFYSPAATIAWSTCTS